MSEPIDPQSLAKSRRKFGGDFGDKAMPAEDATKAVPATKRLTVDQMAEDKALLERARKLRQEAGKE